MAALANLIKNINLPRLMTWAEYNALPTLIKNDGTLYYITDRDDAIQTAATTPALDKDENNSDVQTELDSLKTDLNGILYGPTQVDTTELFNAPNKVGVHSDAWAGLSAKSNDSSAYWNIQNNAKNFHPLRVFFLTGSLRNSNKIICHGAGDTLNCFNLVGGWISNTSKRIACSIPCLNCASSVVLKELKLKILTPQGYIPYMKYGTNAASSIQLNGNNIIWQNSAQKYASSISSLSLTNYHQYIVIQIDFTNALVTASGGTTAIRNNTPITVLPTVIIEFN